MRIILVFVTTIAVTAVLATALSTHFVLKGLREVGAEISFAMAADAVGRDLAGFAPLYAVILALGLAIALPAAAFAHRLTRLPRALVFAAAGAACLTVTLVLMEIVFFGVPVVAGARSAVGFAAQVGAGAVGGLLYASLTRGPMRTDG